MGELNFGRLIHCYIPLLSKCQLANSDFYSLIASINLCKWHSDTSGRTETCRSHPPTCGTGKGSLLWQLHKYHRSSSMISLLKTYLLCPTWQQPFVGTPNPTPFLPSSKLPPPYTNPHFLTVQCGHTPLLPTLFLLLSNYNNHSSEANTYFIKAKEKRKRGKEEQGGNHSKVISQTSGLLSP